MRRLRRWLIWGVIALLLVFVLPVVALRWLPAPTSAFMLASDTTPVRHQWVAASAIPDSARRAVVASEDQKFFEHHGFDVEAMQKAYAHNQKSRRQRGASTISQQTAKNLFLWSGGGYFRKGIEAIYTVLIEALWPKQRILTVYLNIAEFGPGIYGVEAASRAFFNKPASQLSNAEAARLAAVLPSPRKWNAGKPGPYVQQRTGWILRQMGGGGPRAAPLDEPEPEPAPGGSEADDSPAAAAPVPSTPATQPNPEQQLQQQLEREAEERRAAEASRAAELLGDKPPVASEGSPPPP